MKATHHRDAITLIEVLVVLGVIGLLIGLITPAIQLARSASDKLVCRSNMRQIAMAIHHYHNDHGHVPREAVQFPFWQTDPGMLSHLTHLLPYVEHDALFSQSLQAIKTGARPWMNPPHAGLVTRVNVYTCPSDSRLYQVMTDADGIVAAYGSYLPCMGSGERNGAGIFGTVYPFKGSTFSTVYDGLSNTIMIGERPPPDSLQAGKWYPRSGNPLGNYRGLVGPDDAMSMRNLAFAGDPCGSEFWYGPGRIDNPCDRFHFWSLHPGGSFFAFGDASIHWIPYRTDRQIMKALSTRNGRETVSLDD